jgi:hypothetical protein
MLIKIAQDIFISDKKDMNNIKLERYHKKINADIKITEAHGDEDVS